MGHRNPSPQVRLYRATLVPLSGLDALRPSAEFVIIELRRSNFPNIMILTVRQLPTSVRRVSLKKTCKLAKSIHI
ncbi:MAG: hypothetical protein ACTS41_00680 [Candidatus Hodgkinia cicadicola]